VKGAFVADASVAVAWAHPSQATPETNAMLDAVSDGATVEVPALWPLEVANALLVLSRRGKLDKDERQIALGWLQGLPLRIDADGASLAFSKLSELADSYELSIYDAAYVELAHRRKLALACKDEALRRAARKAGVRLWSS
jgi:predicted nucleic acid-binding protein